ncbi:MAG: PEP-CTERM sorting domain-containing protein [Burkholderiales bacterium]|nr:PEP-CTERM sorting domain-containing protein [Burkholderiales bacterium]
MKIIQKNIQAFCLASALFNIATPANALVINATFDSNWLASAPPAATAAINAVDALFGSYFSNPGTVNISFGWNNVNGSVLPAGALGATSNVLQYGTLSQVSSLLSAYSASHPQNAVLASVVSHLPASVSNPGGSTLFGVSQAEMTALTGTNYAGPSAYVGFGNAVNWQYSQAGGIAAGAYDFFGTALHEVSHALGRVSYEFVTPSTPYLTPLDLTRYTCGTTTLNSTSGSTACFSINGGVTDLATFSPTSDSADWAGTSGTSGDPFGAYLAPGITTSMSAVNFQVMQALGWSVPEPGTIFLIAPALGAMVFARRRKAMARVLRP